MKRRELLQWALKGAALSLVPRSFPPLPVRAALPPLLPTPPTGADITVWRDGRYLGTAKAMTTSITQAVMPLYSFGDRNPKAFIKGKRGIAGTLVMTAFDPRLVDPSCAPLGRVSELELRVHEAGQLRYRLTGVMLVNEGWGYTDAEMTKAAKAECAFTYVARELESHLAHQPVGAVIAVNPNFFLTRRETLRVAA